MSNETRRPLQLPRHWLQTVGLALGLLAPFLSQALPSTSKSTPRLTSPRLSKTDVVARLRGLQVKLTSEIGALENSSLKRLKESTSISLKDLNVASNKISRLGDQIDDIERKREELLARRDFISRLALIVDSRWNGQNLQTFLEHTLLDMAANDLSSPEGAGPSWRFSAYLSIAVREIPDSRDDVLGMMENYLAFSSILNPKTPAEFAGRRDYTNAVSSATAQPVPLSQLGDGIEEKLRNLRESLGETEPGAPGAKPQTSKADIELRMPQPTTPPVETPRPRPLRTLPAEP